MNAPRVYTAKSRMLATHRFPAPLPLFLSIYQPCTWRVFLCSLHLTAERLLSSGLLSHCYRPVSMPCSHDCVGRLLSSNQKNSFGESLFGPFFLFFFPPTFPSRLQHFFCYSGIIYLSRLPPYMKPVRHALTRLPEHAPLPALSNSVLSIPSSLLLPSPPPPL